MTPTATVFSASDGHNRHPTAVTGDVERLENDHRAQSADRIDDDPFPAKNGSDRADRPHVPKERANDRGPGHRRQVAPSSAAIGQATPAT